MTVHPSNALLSVGLPETSRFSLREWLGPEYRIRETATGSDALDLLAPAEVDCVVLGGGLPEAEVHSLLGESRTRGVGAVVVAERPSAERAISLIRAGATDCLALEDLGPASLREAILRAIAHTVREREALLHRRMWLGMPLGVQVLEVAPEPGGLTIAYQNPVAQAAHAHARDPSELVAGVDPHTLREVCGRVLLGGEPARLESVDLGDGTDGPVFDVHVSRLDARSVLVLLEDVTELLLVRRQLEAASRMEAIGRLAGGVAHDFNNMLTVISGHAGFVREATDPDDPFHEDAAAILDAASRSAELTRQLLAFSRRQIRAPRILELNATVLSLQPLLRRIIGEHIALETKLDPQAGSILADPAQVEQVLMNLAVNARDAMPGGGELIVQTCDRRVGEAFRPGSFVVEPGDYAELRVIDGGEGMSSETMARMFEPFFTTKSKDEGTGLGLATVYGIVKQSNGCVWAESEVEEGTTFHVLFPRMDAPATELPPPARRDTLPGGETVLFVEDDRLVRRAIRRILETAGYVVLEAELPSRALELAESHDGPLDIILTDIVMPEMSGRELARELAARLPETRVLFTSGYAMDETREPTDVLPPDLPFIAKPFSRQSLLEALQLALSRGPTLQVVAKMKDP